MKKAIFNLIIPNTALCVTVMLIFTTVNHLIQGTERNYYLRLLFLMIGFAVINTLHFLIIGKYEFKNRITMHLSNYLYWFFCLLGVYLLTDWISFSFINIVLLAFGVLISYVCLYFYEYIRIKFRVEEINELIARRSTEK